MSLLVVCSVLDSVVTVRRRVSSAFAYDTVYAFHIGGCTPIPESDLDERSLEESAELFTNHKHLIEETPVPGETLWSASDILECFEKRLVF